MPKYLVKRTVSGLGAMDRTEHQSIAQKSVEALDSMSGRAQWVESFITDDRFYCLYYADNEESLFEHAREGGFPLDEVMRVHGSLDPTAADPDA